MRPSTCGEPSTLSAARASTVPIGSRRPRGVEPFEPQAVHEPAATILRAAAPEGARGSLGAGERSNKIVRQARRGRAIDVRLRSNHQERDARASRGRPSTWFSTMGASSPPSCRPRKVARDANQSTSSESSGDFCRERALDLAAHALRKRAARRRSTARTGVHAATTPATAEGRAMDQRDELHGCLSARAGGPRRASSRSAGRRGVGDQHASPPRYTRSTRLPIARDLVGDRADCAATFLQRDALACCSPTIVTRSPTLTPGM
jgi:hypothetical protein